MATYSWSGINRYGKKISGTVQANNKQQLKSILAKDKIYLLKTGVNPHNFLRFFRISKKNITLLIEQLSLLINANIPILKAFTIINKDIQNPHFRNLVTSCQSSIANGNSLYQTFQQYPQYFDTLTCELINIGEQSGALDVTLSELVNHHKKSSLQRQKIIKALFYPAIVLGITIIVTTIFMIFVIPQFETMFESFGAKLPTYTQAIISISKLFQTKWQITLFSIFGITIGIKTTYQYSSMTKQILDKTIVKTPFIKTILLYNTITRLTKTLNLTIKSGIPLISAMEIGSATIANWQYKHAIQKTIKLLANGKNFGTSLNEQNLFPNKMIQLVIIGEETGNLDSALKNIATIYEEQLTNIVDNLNQFLEPVIIIILSIIVSSLIIGMYLPIFKLGTIL